MKKIFKIIGNIISYTLLVLLLLIISLLFLYVINVKIMEKQNRLSEIPYNFYVILSQSMYPKIKAGDMIMTYKDKNGYDVGEVITFVSHGEATSGITITHRITNKGVNGYVTKGDSNGTEDTYIVQEADIIGKVIFMIPKVGFIQQFIATKFGWLVVVVLPCLGIIIYDLIKLVKRVLNKNKVITEDVNMYEQNDIL